MSAIERRAGEIGVATTSITRHGVRANGRGIVAKLFGDDLTTLVATQTRRPDGSKRNSSGPPGSMFGALREAVAGACCVLVTEGLSDAAVATDLLRWRPEFEPDAEPAPYAAVGSLTGRTLAKTAATLRAANPTCAVIIVADGDLPGLEAAGGAVQTAAAADTVAGVIVGAPGDLDEATRGDGTRLRLEAQAGTVAGRRVTLLRPNERLPDDLLGAVGHLDPGASEPDDEPEPPPEPKPKRADAVALAHRPAAACAGEPCYSPGRGRYCRLGGKLGRSGTAGVELVADTPRR